MGALVSALSTTWRTQSAATRQVEVWLKQVSPFFSQLGNLWAMVPSDCSWNQSKEEDVDASWGHRKAFWEMRESQINLRNVGSSKSSGNPPGICPRLMRSNRDPIYDLFPTPPLWFIPAVASPSSKELRDTFPFMSCQKSEDCFHQTQRGCTRSSPSRESRLIYSERLFTGRPACTTWQSREFINGKYALTVKRCSPKGSRAVSWLLSCCALLGGRQR